MGLVSWLVTIINKSKQTATKVCQEFLSSNCNKLCTTPKILVTISLLKHFYTGVSMKIKTSELTGTALDWAVAKCEGFTDYDPRTEKMLPPRKEYGWVQLWEYNWSTDWSQGGPIIEREFMELSSDPGYELNSRWWATQHKGPGYQYWGPTPLIAAMRCYVASKLGDEVDVPEELE